MYMEYFQLYMVSLSQEQKFCVSMPHIKAQPVGYDIELQQVGHST